MKRAVYLISMCAVFLIFCFGFIPENKVATVHRSVASERNCLQDIKDFFAPKRNSLSAGLLNLVSHLSKFSVDVRLNTLEVMGKLNIQSNEVRRKYAELLNESYKSDLLSLSELKQLVSKINEHSEWVRFGKNNKVYVDLLEDFADPVEVEKLSIDFLKLELNQMEFNALKDIAPETLSAKKDLVISYLSFVRSLKINERSTALDGLSRAIAGDGGELEHIKTFNKYQSDILDFIKKERANGISEIAAMERGKIYEKLVYGCRAKTVNVSRLAANKRFLATMVSLEMVIGGGSYIYNHHDQDHDFEWYKKFAFDMMIDIGNILISSHITTNPGSENVYKMIKYYAVGAAVSVPPAISYSRLFSHSDAQKERTYNEIITSPEFKEKLSELINYLDKEEEKVRLKELLVPVMADPAAHKEMPKDEETRVLLSQALARELYKENQGEWIHTGDVGMDRYVFDRIWGTQSAVRNIAVNLLMYNALCMGELNPKKAYALALSYFILNKGIFDPTYNYLRRKAINQ